MVTEQLSNQAVQLDDLGARLAGVADVIAQIKDAAADTPAAGALAHAVSVWSGAVGHYADDTHSLAIAVGQAAECYFATDRGAVPPPHG